MSIDPISVAIMRTKRTIPIDVLNQAFMPKRYDPTRKERFYDNLEPGVIDHLIKKVIVDGRVAIDVNLISGTELYLPLGWAHREFIDPWNIIYRFDYKATGGRNITAAHEVLYGLTQGVQIGTYGAFDTRASQFLHVSRDILNAAGGTTPVGTAYVQIVAPNTILVNDINQVVGPGVLRCQLSHEPNFNNIPSHYYHAFGELIVLATKSFVYNTLVIDLDEGMLRAGQQIGRFREEVDKLADAETMYMEYLTTKWQKIANMADSERFRKILKITLGGKPKF